MLFLLLISGMSLFSVYPAVSKAEIITFNYQVLVEEDDGFAAGSAEQYIHQSHLAIGDDRQYSVPFQMSAMRFASLDIPRNAKITNASLKIRSLDSEFRGQIYGRIQAEAADNAADFSARYIADSILTTAGVHWDHKFHWSADTWYTSPDISSVIQEVISRPGWQSGNALAIFYSTQAESGKQRWFGAYSSAGTHTPQLEIAYEVYSIEGYVKKTDGTALAGVSVSAGSEIESTITDVNGYYELKVSPGWSGTVTPSKTDWGFTPASRTYNNITSDRINQNFTAFQPSISGTVTKQGSNGLSGVTVSANNGGGMALTDIDGNYTVVVPYNWSGEVTATKYGWKIDPSEISFINIISDQMSQNFTAFQPKISGYVKRLDGTALEGVSVSADNDGGADLTEPNGYYEIIVPYNWSGTVNASKANWGFVEFNKTYQNVITDISEQNYTAFQPVISGIISDKENAPFGGITVTASNGGGSTVTDPNGYYKLTVPYQWLGVITPTLPGWGFSPVSRTFTNVISNQTGQSFTVFQPVISGTVRDANDIGVEGIQLTVDNGIGTTTTDANGYYEFVVPYNWSGTITVSKDGYSFAPETRSYYEVVEDQENQGFVAYRDVVISGYVVNVDKGIEGVQVSTVDGIRSTITDINGYYELELPYNWSGTIVPTKPGLSFAPSELNYECIQENIANQNFEETVQIKTTNKSVKDTYDDAYCIITSDYNIDNYTGNLAVGTIWEWELIGSYYYVKILERYIAGLRFQDVSVPSKAVIASAYLSLKKAEYWPFQYELEGVIQAEDSDAPENFSDWRLPSIYERPKTGNRVYWNHSNWITGQLVTSPDLKNVVQEVIDRAGWKSGNPLVLFYGYTGSNYGCGKFYSSSDYAPRLEINYEYPPKISGYITTPEGAGIEGVEVQATNNGGTGVTNSNGYYELRVPPGWSGLITPSKTAWLFESEYRSLVSAFSDKEGQDFTGYCPYVISGRASDCNDIGTGGVVVSADNGGGNCLTDVNGFYAVPVPRGWSGSISFSKENWFFDPNSIIFEEVSEDLFGHNTLGIRGVLISGVICTSTGLPIEDVEILTSEGHYLAQTDANGTYQITVLPGWSGTTKPVKYTRIFDPPQRTYSNVFNDVTDQNFISLPSDLIVKADGSGDYTTIQNAVYDAYDGDQVIVCPGIYKYFSFGGRAITIRSIDPNDPNIVASTIIKATDRGIYVNKHESRDSILEGFTIESLNFFFQDSSPTIRKCVIKTFYSGYPHIIRCENSSTLFDNCKITGVYYNRYLYPLIFIIGPYEQKLEFRNCIIQLCTDISPVDLDYVPSLFLSVGQDLDLINCTIKRNTNIFGNDPNVFYEPSIILNGGNANIKNTIIRSDLNDVPTIGYIQRPGGSLLNISYSNIDGGREGVMLFNNDSDYFLFRDQGIYDPNIVDANMLNWGPGNIDVDPLFAREPNDGGDGWADDYYTEYFDESFNNDYGDLHLKSEVGRFLWEDFKKTDINKDGIANFEDFAVMANFWQRFMYPGYKDDYYTFDSYLKIDCNDLQIFCEDYLVQDRFIGWVVDQQHSPCIDAGDPNDIDWINEPEPNGGRINMGAYGGTSRASKSIYE